ncbi:replication endonuclease [Sinimarinibacterium sp. CAU 1509]|uniref:replication endonuclease n=1 Tax=Sinimarinibacterium sp. CAU 1509 TaxID=2562283 RepID=UPI0010ABBA4C|nr:replication endonuclease [Sinimarinibacterium sp. CAU 1509]TJY55754.1 replication endonuclease [Sinimarinibacterium sp. CAU 1509]
MQRALMHAASLHEAAIVEQFGRCTPIMVTATLREDVAPLQADASTPVKLARKWFERQVKHYPKAERPRFRFVRVAELTKRGRLHYHFVFFLPPGMRLPMWDKCGWWRHGMTRMEWCRGASVGYVAKYLSKATNGRPMPKGLRMHATGGLTRDEASAKRYHMAPTWVREYFSKEEQPRPMQGGGWWSRINGYIQTSPYFVKSTTAGRVVVGVYKWYRDQLSIKSTQEDSQNATDDTHDACLRYLSRYVLGQGHEGGPRVLLGTHGSAA